MAMKLDETLTDVIAKLLAEIAAGEGLGLAAAGRMFPAFRGEGVVGPSTTYRWVAVGTKAANGMVVRLEAARVGGRWLTSRSAVTRFVAALTEAANPIPPSAPRTPAQRQKSSEAAGRRLKEAG